MGILILALFFGAVLYMGHAPVVMWVIVTVFVAMAWFHQSESKHREK